MAEEVKPAEQQDDFIEYMKKLDTANEKLYEKYRKGTDELQAKMEALAGTGLASYPTFQPFVGIGKIIAVVKQSAIDRDIVNSYLDALAAAGTTEKADVIRVKVRNAITA